MLKSTSAISLTVFVESGGVAKLFALANECSDAINAKKIIQIDFIK
jgi:hypothetical protein